jgi:hypothetical protein
MGLPRRPYGLPRKDKSKRHCEHSEAVPRSFEGLFRRLPLLLPSADRRNDTLNRHCEQSETVSRISGDCP